MENVRRSPGYAESQIRLLLSELGNSSHTVRLKAVKNFMNYIETYKPEVYDDDVDFLYTGFNAEVNAYTAQGLLHYSGSKSEKHEGQLKRISSPTIGLIKSLVTFKGYTNTNNIFYDRFIQLPENELIKINFLKHIMQQPQLIHTAEKFEKLIKNNLSSHHIKKNKNSSSSNSDRSGSVNDAMELLSILIRDHRNSSNEPDPINIDFLLEENKICKDKLIKWLQKYNSMNSDGNVMNTSMLLEDISNKKLIIQVRPKVWSEVIFKPVPLQEDEMGVLETVEDISHDGKGPVLDPLGLQEGIDLRVVQDFLNETSLKKQQQQRQSSSNIIDNKRRISKEGGITEVDIEDTPMQTLLPTDKTFSPTLFLSYVHGGASFHDLSIGAKHLETMLAQQSSRRVNIVREHFGLFVLCAEGLEMLKLGRLGVTSRFQSGGSTDSADGDVATGGGNINKRLLQAQSTLNTAKFEAESALAPLLQRHRRSKEIRKAEQELRNISSIVELPQLMQNAFETSQYEEVVSIYAKVVKMSRSKSSNDSSAVTVIIDKVKSKADTIMEGLKKKCEDAMRQTGKAPQVSQIMRYWKVLCSFESVTSEALEPNPGVQLLYLRSTFEGYLIQFTECLKKVYDDLKPAGAHALTSGQNINSLELMTNSKSTTSLTSRVLMIKHSGSIDYDDTSSYRRSNKVVDDDEYSDYSDNLTDNREEDDTDFDVEISGGEKILDNSKRLCFELRLGALKKLVDTAESWLPSLHDLALILTNLAQNNVSGGSRRLAGTAGNKSVLIMIAKELVKLSHLSTNLVKGMSDSLLSWGSSDSAFNHINFTSPLTSKYLTFGYEEIFCLYELIDGLNNSFTSSNAHEEIISAPKNPYNDSVILLKDSAVEGEILSASNIMLHYTQKIATMLITLEQGLNGSREKQTDWTAKSAQQNPSLIFKTITDFELISVRTFRKLYSSSSRPEWILEVFREGLQQGFNSLVNSLSKLLLHSDIDDLAGFNAMLDMKTDFEYETIDLLIKQTEAQQINKITNDIFSALRACIYVRLLALPKLMQEIQESFEGNPAGKTRSSNSSVQKVGSFENSALINTKKAMLTDATATVMNFETSLRSKYISSKSWFIRKNISMEYKFLISTYHTNSKPMFPLLNVLLQLSEERERIDSVFTLALQSYSDYQIGSAHDKSALPIASYGHILFSELCKQVSAFYIDLVAGLHNCNIDNVLETCLKSGIALVNWNRKDVILKSREEIGKQFLSKSSRAVGSSTECSWPLILETALHEANYISKLVKSTIQNDGKLYEDIVLRSFPISSVQFQIDIKAYSTSVKLSKNIEDMLEMKLQSVALLLS